MPRAPMPRVSLGEWLDFEFTNGSFWHGSNLSMATANVCSLLLKLTCYRHPNYVLV